jgi:glycosyltransferase involved in cell wall biosynthesis
MQQPKKSVLWWGRFDPGYSRSGILRKLLQADGWEIRDFHPAMSSLADLQAYWRRIEEPDLVWVPCCRQRDLTAARRYANRFKVPLLFDPLISAYDKRVFEKKKYPEASRQARRLRRWESRLFQAAGVVLADTSAHAEFFVETLEADPEKVFVVPVGAEEDLFVPQPPPVVRDRPEVLFYGSFVHLQGADVIVDAAKQVPEVDWVLLGQGKLRSSCEEAAAGVTQVRFEEWVPYEKLAERIGQADILLGVFGGTPKAARVIPNKFYQAIACARPIITLDSPVYTEEVRAANRGGIRFVPPGDPAALAEAVRTVAMATAEDRLQMGRNARELYEVFYAEDRIRIALQAALKSIGL